MERRNDWLVQLNRVLAKYDAGVDPAEINCANFVGEAVAAMTGSDLMEPFAGMTIDEQIAHLQVLGYEDPVDYVSERLVEIKTAFAKVGDVAVFTVRGKPPVFGVVIGEYVRVITPEGQPGLLPVDKARKVFQL